MRVAAGLLAVLLLALTACSGGGEGSETTAAPQTQQPDETTAAVDDGPKLDQYGHEIIEADLPDVRFDGETFTIHTRGNVSSTSGRPRKSTANRSTMPSTSATV